MALLNQSAIDANRGRTLLGISTIDQTTIYPLTGIPLATNTVFALTTAIVDASGNQITSFGGGTQYTDGGTPPAHPLGTMPIWNNGGVWSQTSLANGLPVQVATGAIFPVKTNDVVDTNNSSTATLLANITFTGTGTDTLGYTSISVYVYSDQSSAANGVKIEFSSDNSNWNDATVDTFTSGNAAPNDGQTYIATCRARYMRVLYTNGAVNQTAFRLNTVLRVGTLSGDVIPVADVPTSVADHALLTKTAIMGKTTAGGGAWVDVKVNPSGALTTASTTQDAGGNSITSNSTTTTATVGLDVNIRSILNTAPTTAGFLDIKGADGNVFVRQATAANLNATVVGTGTFATQSTLQTQTDTTMIGGVNIKEINAVTPLMGNGVTGTGSQRVTVASDNTGIANWGHGATAASVPSGATYQGVRGATALPTAVTNGQMVGAMGDKYGRPVAIIGTIRDLVGTQTTTISASTAETTIVTAAASTFNDIVMMIISNTSASTNTRIDFRDTTGGSVLFSLESIGGAAPVGFALPVPIPQTSVNTNWTAQCATPTTDVRIYAVYQKNK